MHPIRVQQTVWRLFLGTRNHVHGCSLLRKLHFSNIIWWLALGFSMDLWFAILSPRISLDVVVRRIMQHANDAFPSMWIVNANQENVNSFSPTFQSGFSKSIRTISKGFQKCFNILKGSRNCFKYSEKQISFSHRNLYNLHLLSNSSPAKTFYNQNKFEIHFEMAF